MDDQEFDLEPEDGDLLEEATPFDWGEGEPSEGEEPDVLRFELGSRSFAVEAQYVGEVAPVPTLTELPGLPSHVLGVAVRRRHVLSVFNLATFLSLSYRSKPSDRLIVFDIDGTEAGVIVSGLAGLEVWPEDAEPPSLDVSDSIVARYAIASRWAPGGRVVLLDISEIVREAAVR